MVERARADGRRAAERSRVLARKTEDIVKYEKCVRSGEGDIAIYAIGEFQ